MTVPAGPIQAAALVLSDGSVFEGEMIGATPIAGIASGEVVFNTVLGGYQEVLTDPSYAGQIITFTYPHIGNYGVTLEDFESRRPACRGVVVRDLARRQSNHRSQGHLDAFLRAYGVAGIAGIDTRRLTRLIREAGALNGAFGTAPESDLLAAARNETGTDGLDLVATVTTPSAYTVGDGPRHIVAYDFGIKYAIVDYLATLGRVTVVPAAMPAAEVLAMKPTGVFLSNGPGDPQAVPYAVDNIAALIGKVPTFGICLGHQLMSLALGGSTFKLPFGHHGGNHPVRRLATGQVEITSQNHNFCVDPSSLADNVTPTHVNLNDGTNEGIWVTNEPAFSVQYHPEAGPGPHDASYLFTLFAEMMDDPAGWRSALTPRRAVAPRVAGKPAAERGVA